MDRHQPEDWVDFFRRLVPPPPAHFQPRGSQPAAKMPLSVEQFVRIIYKYAAGVQVRVRQQGADYRVSFFATTREANCLESHQQRVFSIPSLADDLRKGVPDLEVGAFRRHFGLADDANFYTLYQRVDGT